MNSKKGGNIFFLPFLYKKMQLCFKNPIFTTPGLPLLKPSQTQIRNFIVCARKKRRQPFLNRKANKLILETALTFASNLNVIPPPLTDLIREFGGWGGGGGIGTRKGSGGGGGGEDGRGN